MARSNSTDEQAIRQQLEAYGAALLNRDLEKALSLYTSDGVFMAPGNPAMCGAEGLRKAYERVFSSSRLELKFDYKEIVIMSEEWAFARTTAAGTKQFITQGTSETAANQELFILRKIEATWKIARYGFSSMKPML